MTLLTEPEPEPQTVFDIFWARLSVAVIFLYFNNSPYLIYLYLNSHRLGKEYHLPASLIIHLLLQLYEVQEDEDGGSQINFTIPREASGGIVNNKKEQHKFRLVKCGVHRIIL